MAKASTTNEVNKIPVWKVALGSLAGFILIVVLSFAFRSGKNEPGIADQKVVSDRLERLSKLREEQRVAVSSYKWEDKEAGVVRIPLEKAMALTLDELKQKPVTRSTTPVQTVTAPAAAPVPAAEPAKKGS